jgi:ribonuclease P protein subunit RPR2
VDENIAIAQSLKYAEELQQLYVRERQQRSKVEEAVAKLEESYRTTVRALAAALELRDDGTGAHAERVSALALVLAAEVAPDLTSDPELEYGFLLHDLGKIGVPDAILLKPGPLTRREMEEMRYHPILGEKIVATIPYLSGLARQVVAAHHEHWDGGGYPRGLAGERIPVSARIFAIADAFDAMTNDRPYRQALAFQVAMNEIAEGAGTQFDPALAAAFVDLAPAISSAAAA